MNEVRIIGGMWKRRKLGFPNRPTLRPTPDRTRETLFNWLVRDVPDARCLDLFAGSGALGFEALSRGARHVTFVERDRAAAAALAANATRLDAHDRCTVVRSPVLPWLRREQTMWDLVFLDPPYRSAQVAPTLELLSQRPLLAPHALVAVDLPAGQAPLWSADDAPFEVVRQTRAGAAQLVLLTPRRV